MKIQPFILGFGYTNSYVVYYDDRSAYIIDAPNGTKKLQTFIEQNNLKAEASLHMDIMIIFWDFLSYEKHTRI